MTSAEVWITGYGAVTAAGPATGDLLEIMRTARSAVRPLAEFGVHGARIDDVPESPRDRRLDRSGRLFVAAAEEAWHRAGLDEAPLHAERVALLEGSSLGPLAAALQACRIEVAGDRRARPVDLLRFMPGMGGTTFAEVHGIRGPVLHLSAGSVSAACAVGEAYERIVAGAADLAVAGGTEAPFDRSIVQRLVAAGIVQAMPAATCRPFDHARQGTVLGEGAGVLILESRRHAEQRGAVPHAVLCGYGLVSEAYSQAAPDPSGAGVQRATMMALGESDDPAWIKAHGTGTRAGDEAEYRGLASVFGSRLRGIPVTGLKSTIGHCLGASAGVEAVAAVIALEHGFIPASLGTTHVDPAFPLYTVVMQLHRCQSASVLLLAEGFGGRCAALLAHAP